jgi:hypothetical protein
LFWGEMERKDGPSSLKKWKKNLLNFPQKNKTRG